ncbi:hypothetical protein [Leptothoe spongobia]|uniref:Uncharacterized protein n=1 Tax=Leptothoe spongobia TAU-MAC 1115 TaxID=1967444 RepID=A0A947GIE7_9CYAN|nr:hypothetical protein [Leptothoe spongobia]MBT9316120.1 hypothetical protein [Leptothoe spongobia TAU-MAC 1115]
MSLFLEDFDQWYEHYSEASPQEQYQLLLEVISKPIPLELAEKEDIASLLIDVQGLLEGNNLIEQALAFTATFQQQQPELYQQEFYYFDNFPIRVALFNQAVESIDQALARYQQEPVKSIDSLLPMLDDLRFYGARDQAVEISRAVYVPVATSRGLLGGSEDDFGAVVITDLLEQAYQQIQQGHPVDWEAWGQEAKPFSFENTPELRQEIAQNISGQVLGGPEIITLFQQDPSVLFPQLLLRFNIQMANQYQLSFVCSQSIWSAVMSFLEERELSDKQLSHPGHFFSINAKELDRYVGGLIGGFLSSYQSKGFATLWGIPHVYDFLRAAGVITDSVYESAIQVSTDLQEMLLKHWQRPLWRYSFVHRWGKPAYQTEADFEAEAKRFADTFNDSESLSTEPTEKPDWGARFSDVVGKAVEKMASDQAPAKSPAPVKNFKAPKPRKSRLQEIKALGKKSKGAKKKKKKGKGF